MIFGCLFWVSEIRCKYLSINELALKIARAVHHFFLSSHNRPELNRSLILFLNPSKSKLNGRIKSLRCLRRENVIWLSRSLPEPLYRHRSPLIDRSCPVDFLSLIADLCVNVEISHLSEYQHLPPKSDLLVHSLNRQPHGLPDYFEDDRRPVLLFNHRTR